MSGMLMQFAGINGLPGTVRRLKRVVIVVEEGVS